MTWSTSETVATVQLPLNSVFVCLALVTWVCDIKCSRSTCIPI